MSELISISELITTYGVIPILAVIIWYLYHQNKGLIRKLETQQENFILLQKEHHDITLEREKQVVAIMMRITSALNRHKIKLNDDDE